MNLGQLNTLLLSWLDDPQGTYFTPAQTNVWLNNAQREVQKQLLQSGENWYVIKVSASMIANIDSYVLPANFRKLSKLEIVTSGTGVNEIRQMLSPVTLVQLDQVSMTTGTPAAYNIKKNCFTVRPIPDRAYTMYLHYSYLVADMANTTDTPDVPVAYQEYVAVQAGLDGYIKDGRDMSQLMAKKTFYEKMMEQDSQERNVDAPRDIISTNEWEMGILF